MIAGNVIAPTMDVGIEIPFLIDTGADTTCISGIDAAKAYLLPENLDDKGVDYEEITVQGVDETTAFQVNEPVMLAFEDHSEKLDQWSLHVELMDGIEILPKSPMSLLGRDILNRFDISYSTRDGEIEMQRRDFVEGVYLCMSMEEEIAPELRDFDDREDSSDDDGDSKE